MYNKANLMKKTTTNDKGSSRSLLDLLNEPSTAGIGRKKGLGDTTSGLGTVNSKGTKDGISFISRVHI